MWSRFDLGNFAKKPDYYWNYQSQEFNDLFDKISTHRALPTAHACWATPSTCWPRFSARLPLHPQCGDRGKMSEAARLWKDMPVFVNDLSALSWG